MENETTTTETVKAPLKERVVKIGKKYGKFVVLGVAVSAAYVVGHMSGRKDSHLFLESDDDVIITELENGAYMVSTADEDDSTNELTTD